MPAQAMMLPATGGAVAGGVGVCRLPLLPVLPVDAGVRCAHQPVVPRATAAALGREGKQAASERLLAALAFYEHPCWDRECPNSPVPGFVAQVDAAEELLNSLPGGTSSWQVTVRADQGEELGYSDWIAGTLTLTRLLALAGWGDAVLIQEVSWDGCSRELRVTLLEHGGHSPVMRALVLDGVRSRLVIEGDFSTQLMLAVPGWCEPDVRALLDLALSPSAADHLGRRVLSLDNPRWELARAREPGMPADVAVVLERLCASAHQVPSVGQLRELAARVVARPAGALAASMSVLAGGG